MMGASDFVIGAFFGDSRRHNASKTRSVDGDESEADQSCRQDAEA
jgi:hypothetical protein